MSKLLTNLLKNEVKKKTILVGSHSSNDIFYLCDRILLIKDKKHYYAYSNYSLALSFPMIERDRNQKYLDYVENKSKWKNGKDFDVSSYTRDLKRLN